MKSQKKRGKKPQRFKKKSNIVSHEFSRLCMPACTGLCLFIHSHVCTCVPAEDYCLTMSCIGLSSLQPCALLWVWTGLILDQRPEPLVWLISYIIMSTNWSIFSSLRGLLIATGIVRLQWAQVQECFWAPCPPLNSVISYREEGLYFLSELGQLHCFAMSLWYIAILDGSGVICEETSFTSPADFRAAII